MFLKIICIPEVMPEPFAQGDRIMHLQKVHQVFSSQAGPLCARVIRASKEMNNPSSFKGGKRFFYLFSGIEPFEISFDKSGKIIESSISNVTFLEKSSVLKKLCLLLLSVWHKNYHGRIPHMFLLAML